MEFGDGFSAVAMRGSQHNDPFIDLQGRTARNGAGGINGGITNGNDIVLRIAVKPTSSIASAQHTSTFPAMKWLTHEIQEGMITALRSAVVTEATACSGRPGSSSATNCCMQYSIRGNHESMILKRHRSHRCENTVAQTSEWKNPS